ncbi:MULTISPECIES: WecB/TagA/CpsF family glycosyltransferase [unclassified Rhizobium]|uniref:WecB/TagA/CpsF family glycosyltransferase n=1 Tax=unclassified Rhizobium TaxID=2613769 RepID=UPI0007E940CC|nr:MULTISPECIES: WecB/TagA/CpsF family glycosyltransferase [unclassified Rhizobium]ANM13341.1 WecB/TagA/CpsF family glycosyltransferase protein [Rhizobium sp. N324]ANM19741.1 WecB/TagA/CpsF family glycosyltransferase protein [Rhizobium sp. N541]ANM26126.1 WecB/TagA/CpsF family glycosyltransferase protein [Rhizobium sp. N941]OYD01131.1 WecB/TagA/CpsF family glycosyltransferase protein [Rhizobium sp. N4311]
MRKQPAGSSPTSVLRPEGSFGWTNVLGVRVSAVNLKSATGCIQKAIEDGRKGYVCVRDAHGIVRCQDDPELRSIHNQAFLVTPDGMPLVWALRHAGHTESDRVYGPDLMLSVFDAGGANGLRHFLYGATAETLEQLQARLLAKFPQARIVGSYAPPFRKLSTREEADIADRLNRSGADIVWVGLSSPKQELWMARMRDRLDASMLIGVGAAFDFHAGLKRQAPRFIQRSGFEWAFRLLCEPRRLWRRYALVVPAFISLTAFQRLGLRKFPIEDGVSGSSASGQMQ